MKSDRYEQAKLRAGDTDQDGRFLHGTKTAFHRDGLTIRGHLWGKAEGCRHAVILSHGFLANERMCHKYARLLAGMGFLAVTFDFCGGGIVSGSDGRSRDMTVLTEQADLTTVIGEIRSRYAPAGISLLGCSQGGLVSGLAAAELGTGLIESLVLLYPAVCIPDDARRGKMMFYRFDPRSIPELLGRFPMAVGGAYARYVLGMDPYRELCGYSGPVLLLHGTEDAVVDISYARRLAGCYPDCRYEEILGGGHVFRGDSDAAACRALTDFMQTRVLPPRP